MLADFLPARKWHNLTERKRNNKKNDWISNNRRKLVWFHYSYVNLLSFFFPSIAYTVIWSGHIDCRCTCVGRHKWVQPLFGRTHHSTANHINRNRCHHIFHRIIGVSDQVATLPSMAQRNKFLSLTFHRCYGAIKESPTLLLVVSIASAIAFSS